jgi:hypothetical protein
MEKRLPTRVAVISWEWESGNGKGRHQSGMDWMASTCKLWTLWANKP